MAEPIYEIDPNAEYDPSIRKLQDSDPASASGTFNPLVQRLVDNTDAVHRKVVDTVEKVECIGSIGMLVTLATTGWTLTSGKYYKTVEIEDIRAAHNQTVGAYPDDLAKAEEYDSCRIIALTPQVDGSLTFVADSVPKMEVIAAVIQTSGAVRV